MEHVAAALHAFHVPSDIQLQIKIFSDFNREAFTGSDILLAFFTTWYKLRAGFAPIFVLGVDKIIAYTLVAFGGRRRLEPAIVVSAFRAQICLGI